MLAKRQPFLAPDGSGRGGAAIKAAPLAEKSLTDGRIGAIERIEQAIGSINSALSEPPPKRVYKDPFDETAPENGTDYTAVTATLQKPKEYIPFGGYRPPKNVNIPQEDANALAYGLLHKENLQMVAACSSLLHKLRQRNSKIFNIRHVAALFKSILYDETRYSKSALSELASDERFFRVISGYLLKGADETGKKAAHLEVLDECLGHGLFVRALTAEDKKNILHVFEEDSRREGIEAFLKRQGK